MSDELKAIAHKARELWHDRKELSPEMLRDVALAYIDHLDSEAERDLPITREWLESIGFKNGDHLAIKDEFMLSMDGYRLAIHVEGDDAYGAIYALHLPHITTRGQVLDLLRVLGVKP